MSLSLLRRGAPHGVPPRARVAGLARRLVYFCLVWTALLFVHEAGHAVTAWRQGIPVRRVTVGIGPVLWRTQLDAARLASSEHATVQSAPTLLELRLVPIAGVTTLGERAHATAATQSKAHIDASHGIASWIEQLLTLGGGVLATLALALGVTGLVVARERASGRTWALGRWIVADAVVLTVFNFLPVPPLDGGRAVLGTVAMLRGAPLSGDALFWVQAGGMALAVIPMTLWTRWTARIDSAAMRWGRPLPPARLTEPHQRSIAA